MELLMITLERELPDLHKNGVRLRVIGEHAGLGAALRGRIAEAQAQTDANTDMTLVVAIGYGGQWDIVQRSEEHTSELQSLMRSSYAGFCLKTKMTNTSATL